MRQTSLFDRGLQRLRVPAERRPDDLDESVRLRWVPEWEGYYAVTDNGRVYSYKNGKWGTKKKPHELDGGENRKGYYRVNLTENDHVHTYRVHRLVLRAFRGDPPTGKTQCRHLNGDRKDNRLANLRWGSAQDNQRDKEKHGNQVRGERVPNSQLTPNDVIEIRKRYVEGDEWLDEIAEDYPVQKNSLRVVIDGTNWSWVDGPTCEVRVELSEDEVESIRETYAYTDKTQREIGEEYGVTRRCIEHAVNGKSHKDAPGPIKGEDY